MLSESLDLEKEQLRRDEQRKSRDEQERMRREFQHDYTEAEKRHSRQMEVVRSSTEKEIEAVRRSLSSGIQINNLLEKVGKVCSQCFGTNPNG